MIEVARITLKHSSDFCPAINKCIVKQQKWVSHFQLQIRTPTVKFIFCSSSLQISVLHTHSASLQHQVSAVDTGPLTPKKPFPWRWFFVKGKVILVLNTLSIMPWRRVREWRYSSTVNRGNRRRWSASRSCRFIPDTRYIGGWVGPQTGLDTEEKRNVSCPCRAPNPRFLSGPARNPSAIPTELCRLLGFLCYEYCLFWH
jgi:hypothetical protein